MSESPITDVRWQEQSAVVDVAGEIDLHKSQAFQQGLLEVLQRGPKTLVVNLSDVGYMDSSGVASLVKLLSRTRKVGVKLALAGMNEKVRSIFEITRLDGVFTMYDTEQEALEA